MHLLEATVLSILLMILIYHDVRRFPIPKHDKGSRFFVETFLTYGVFLLLSLASQLFQNKYLAIPVTVAHFLWILHMLSFPILLALWMHFTAINLVDDSKQVRHITFLLVIPLIVLSFLAIIDMPYHHFLIPPQPLDPLPPSIGSKSLFLLSLFYCFVILGTSLFKRSGLKGAKPFLSLLLPLTQLTATLSFAVNHDHALFTMANSFMLVLIYLVVHRETVVLDELTQLPKEALLKRRLLKIFKNEESYSIILIDVENFQYFNARHGHLVGDLLLTHLARFLEAFPLDHETFKLTGDRFCLLFPDEEGKKAENIAKDIQERMQKRWTLGQHNLYASVNMVLVSVPTEVPSFAELQYISEQQLQKLKTKENQSILVYTKELSLAYQQEQNIISALHEAIYMPDHIHVYYQPIHCSTTKTLTAAEALLRIQDPQLGLLQPSQCIPLAEQTTLIVDITPIVLRKACQLYKNLEAKKLLLDHISVNLSAEDFNTPDLANRLLSIILEAGIAPSRIRFEITESMVLKSYEAVAHTMHILTKQGIQFALDDFGVGYSNLSALLELPFQQVKFDKSLIQKSQEDSEMLPYLTDMLHAMGKNIVAEGVETTEQEKLVRDLGIGCIQGFLYNKPLCEEAFIKTLTQSTEPDGNVQRLYS